ncbi:hypothetical protein L218DRAFT_1024229 [Marasmius fiardii PR-910]|nr:hypothetical protein L218DRAFT_1024229 [Marasmius fiardii PR-910]
MYGVLGGCWKMEPQLLVFVYDHTHFTSASPFITFDTFSPILLRFLYTLFHTLDMIHLSSFLHLYLIHVQYSRHLSFLHSRGLLRTHYLRSFINFGSSQASQSFYDSVQITLDGPVTTPWQYHTSLGQDTSIKTRSTLGSASKSARCDHLEENGWESEGIFFGNLDELSRPLARRGYAAEKAVDLGCAEDALSLMDMIQHYLDEERSHDNLNLRKTCIRCLVYLNKRHGTLPTSIHLSKVIIKDGQHPVSGGGYAMRINVEI